MSEPTQQLIHQLQADCNRFIPVRSYDYCEVCFTEVNALKGEITCTGCEAVSWCSTACSHSSTHAVQCQQYLFICLHLTVNSFLTAELAIAAKVQLHVAPDYLDLNYNEQH